MRTKSVLSFRIIARYSLYDWVGILSNQPSVSCNTISIVQSEFYSSFLHSIIISIHIWRHVCYMKSNEIIDNDSVLENGFYHITILFPARFKLLLISWFVPMISYLFVMHQLIFNPVLRQRLKNHRVIVLLLVNIVYDLIGILCFSTTFIMKSMRSYRFELRFYSK